MNKKNIKRLAIIAGDGWLPKQIYDAAKTKGIHCEVIGIEGSICPIIFDKIKFYSLPPYAVSKIIQKLNLLNIDTIVFAGKVDRQNISKLLLDSKGAKLFAMILRKGLNDNAVLATILKFFEQEGFNIVAPEEIATNIVASKGNITLGVKISRESKDDMNRGFNILKGIGHFDIGQSLVIENGLVLGIEAVEGTDDLIKRCSVLRQNQERSGVLVKVCKPQQDKRVDLPCIGLKTIELADEAGLTGIAIEANYSLITDSARTIEAAKERGIYIYGI